MYRYGYDRHATIKMRGAILGPANRQKYRKSKTRRFRFNAMNITCLALLPLAVIFLLISHSAHLSQGQKPGSPGSAVVIETTPVPLAAAPGSSQSPAANEHYSFDAANNHWAYNGPELSVDVKKLHDDALKIWYYVADIIVKDPKAFRSGMSNEVDPVKNRALPGDLALKYQAVLATNGDLFAARKTGVIIRNGKLWRNVPHEPILAFYANGDMKVFGPTEKTAQQLLDEGVTNTFAFGPILIRDGVIDHAALKSNSLRPPNPRTGIGAVGKNHFVSVVVEGRQPGYSKGITLDDFALLFQRQGCTTAYNLDGGQSSAMMFMGQPLNSHANDMNGTKWNTYRHMSEILIFGNSQLIPTTQSTYGSK